MSNSERLLAAARAVLQARNAYLVERERRRPGGSCERSHGVCRAVEPIREDWCGVCEGKQAQHDELVASRETLEMSVQQLDQAVDGF